MAQNPYLEMARRFVQAIPHNADLGIEVVDIERGIATLRLPGKAELCGDPERQLYFPSVLLALADAASGVAYVSAINEVTAVATLDLRIDYLRPVSVAHPLVARAHCHRHTLEVGFLQCDIRAEGAEEAAAMVTASFIRVPAKKGQAA